MNVTWEVALYVSATNRRMITLIVFMQCSFLEYGKIFFIIKLRIIRLIRSRKVDFNRGRKGLPILIG